MFNWAFKKIVKLREKVAVDLGDGDVEKPFLDHLDDLRAMIVRMCVTMLIVTVGTFVFHQELLSIIQYPLVMAGIQDKVTLQNFRVTGGFMTAMNVSLVAGLVLAFPFLLYFLLQFVLPGLRSNEKKVIFPALGVGAGLFLTGVVFAYYLVAPRALEFFYEFSVAVGSSTSAQQVGAATPATASSGPAFSNGFGVIWERKIENVRQTVETSVDGTNWTALTPPPAPEGTSEPKSDPAATEFRYVRITCVPATAGGGAESSPGPIITAVGPPAAIVASPFIWELTEYVKFVCQFVLIFGACFELPVVVMALVKLDVLNYKVMKGSRAWAAIIICVVAAIITPTQDALTLGLLALPMYVLYEICIWLAWWMEKKDRQLYPEYYKEQDADAKEVAVADDWDNESYNPFSQEEDEEDVSTGTATATTPKPVSTLGETPASAEAPATSEPPASQDPPHESESPPTAKGNEDSKPADDGPDVEKRDTD